MILIHRNLFLLNKLENSRICMFATLNEESTREVNTVMLTMHENRSAKNAYERCFQPTLSDMESLNK